MVRSFENCITEPVQPTFHIFTDQVCRADEFAKENLHLDIQTHEIESMGFPEATLLRYKIYDKFKNQLKNDVLMHLDADMLIRDNKFLSIENITKLSAAGVALVSHPGYWRPTGLERLKLLFRNPQIAIRDLKIWVKFGGVGAWETRKESGAYVPRRDRKHYICGGIWAGKNNEFKALCKELSNKTNSDLALNQMPIWHDESYINNWASNHAFELLSASFCFDPRYPQLSNLENFVEAVDKNA